MSLPRHNGGHFTKYHGNGDPVITNYDDAYSFLVEDHSKFRLEDAVSIHLFNINIRVNVQKIEDLQGRKMTAGEIDSFISDRFASHDLRATVNNADRVISEYSESVEALAIRELTSKLPNKKVGAWPITYIGAYQGVCGNALSFFIFVFALLIVLVSKDTDLTKHVTAYYNSCIAPLASSGFASAVVPPQK